MPSAGPLRLGTRGSALALAQARLVAEALAAAGATVETVIIRTAGDDRAPDTAWGEGAFVGALEKALLEGRIDLAVHSAKDIPTQRDERFTIAAYLSRADPRDALVLAASGHAASLAELPPGARVGTDSPRRTGFLLAERPDLRLHPLHGNVDTRLRRLDSGESDALVLAVAGLARLGRSDRVTEPLDAATVPPAPGQGAIAVQTRSDDEAALGVAARLDDTRTRRAVEAERAFLAASGGGCRAPIGALASVDGERLVLLGGHVRPDGTGRVVDRITGRVEAGEGIGAELARRLLGGATRRGRRSRHRVLVTRAADQAGPLLDALIARGLEPIVVPAIAVESADPADAAAELEAALRRLGGNCWAVVTSANGARALVATSRADDLASRGVRVAAIGDATAAVLLAAGFQVAFRPSAADGAMLADELPVQPGDAVVVVRGDLASPALRERLEQRGAVVEEIVGYRTLEAPGGSHEALLGALAGPPPVCVLFASGSAVRGLLGLADESGRDGLRAIPAVCIGRRTAEVAEREGFAVVAVASDQSVDGLAEAAASAALGPRTEPT